MDDRLVKATVHNAIVDALIKYMPETIAKEVVRAIVRGEVQELEIRYERNNLL